MLRLTPSRKRQRLNNRQEHAAGSRGGARHRRRNKRLAERQPITQPQRTLPQPFHEVRRDPIPQPSLHEATSEEEGNHNQPYHLVGERAKSRRES